MTALRSCASLLCLALLLGCSSAAERDAGARAEARAALERGDRAEALAALRGAPADETSPEALLDRAALLTSAGETAQAVWLLEGAVKRHPGRADLSLGLGRLALMVDNATAARDAVRGIPPGSEHHAAALLVTAQAELLLGSLERALEVLKEAERLYPERLEARLVRVSTLATERRLAEARALLEETKRAHAPESLAAEIREPLRRLDVTLLSAQAEQGEGEAAIAGLRALLAEDPGNAQVWQALVNALWRERRPGEALETVEKALAEDPARLALYPLAATLNAALGKPEEAERVLRALIERSPTASSYGVLAQLFANRRETPRVLETWSAAAAALPEDPVVARLQAEALLDAGRPDEAEREIARFRKLAPRDLHGEFLRARLELARDDARGARQRLEKLVPELDQAYTQYWLGQALERQGDTAGAERRYALAMARNPADPGLYAPLIRLAQLRGDWREAAATAQLLVRRQPGLPEGWAALAGALLNLGAGEDLEKVAKSFAGLFPDRPEAALFVARALRVRGKYDAALEELAAIEKRLGASPDLAGERALVLGLAGRVQEGIDALEQPLRESPDAAVLYATRAALLYGAGRGEEGAQATDRALELAPDDPSPLRSRAEFRAATGANDAARADCERYLKLRPDDAGVHFILGAVNHQAGRRGEAITAYRRAAELDDTAWQPRNNLAVLLADGDPKAALEVAQQAYALAPANADVLDTLGWLYLAADRVDRSISLLEDARRAAPANPEIRLHLALAYQKAGRGADARPLLAALRDDAAGPPEIRARAEEALRSLP
jgi:tetratricopeptide (TPR) repeat protein